MNITASKPECGTLRCWCRTCFWKILIDTNILLFDKLGSTWPFGWGSRRPLYTSGQNTHSPTKMCYAALHAVKRLSSLWQKVWLNIRTRYLERPLICFDSMYQYLTYFDRSGNLATLWWLMLVMILRLTEAMMMAMMMKMQLQDAFGHFLLGLEP